MASYMLDIPQIDHEAAQDRNFDNITRAVLPAYKTMEVARQIPEIAGELYDELPLSEIAAETLVPWQYKAYNEAQKAGKDYKFDKSAWAADVLEMTPLAGLVCGAESMDNAMDAGEDYDAAVGKALGVGGAVTAASAIPGVGKLAKAYGKIAPKASEVVSKVISKAGTPLSYGGMFTLPYIGEAAFAKEPEATPEQSGDFGQHENGFYYEPRK